MPRERLVHRLDAHPGRVVLLSAPAGFGKTVLVADWTARRAVPVAWLSLDPLDNDPQRFVAHLAAALEASRAEGLGRVVGALRGGLSTDEDDRPDLRDALAAVSDETVLVLDDLHEIQAPPVLRLVETLIAAPESGLRVALLGRMDPNVALGRLRVSGQLLELRARDLAFTTGEAERLLREMLGRALDPPVLRALTERTEGWPAGLRLAGIALADVEDPATFVASFAGTHRFVTEYLMEEALGRQSPELQRFLMESAVLAHFDATCCRDVLGDPEAPARLAEARAANLFLVPLAGEEGWYRYHHLFGELLAYRLERTRPERFQALHGRASDWFETRGEIQEALEHAARLTDPTRLLELLDAHGLDLIGRSEMAGLRRWLRQVEPVRTGPYPLAFCTEAWLRVVTERAPDLDPLLARIEAALAAAPPHYPTVRKTRAALHTRVLAAYAARYRHRLEEALRIGREAEALLTEDDPLTRGFLVYNTGRVHMALGEMEPAARLLDQAFPDHLRAGNRYLTLATLGRQGALVVQTEGVRRALETLHGGLDFARARGMDGNPALSIVHFHRGWVHLLADDLDDADGAFVEALEGAGPRDFPEERANALVGRARVALARGALDRAEAFLAEVASLGRTGNVDLFETTLPLERLRLALRRGEVRGGPPAAPVREVPEAGEAEPKDRWSVHREVATILELRRALGGGAEAVPVALADLLVDRSVERSRGTALLVGLLARAMHPATPNRWALVDRALRLSADRDYVRPVVELGPAVGPLLRAAARRPELSPESRARAGHLLTRVRTDPEWPTGAEEGSDAPAGGGPPGLPADDAAPYPPEALTEREAEVLAELFSGRTNKGIARTLHISVDTVKTHLKHIYAKLGVSGRSQAVLRARAMGYEPDPG